MSIVIHIGFHKTATSWFQKQFYPKVENFKYFSNRTLFRKELINPDYFVFDANNARKIILNTDISNTVICEENILSGLRVSSVFSVVMAQRLHKVFPEAEIVIFIRSQPQRIASAYLYYLKENGGTYSPKKFIKKHFDLPNQKGSINFHHLEYHRIIEYYQELFGKQKVHVYIYEDFAKNNLDFISRYSNEMGFDVDYKTLSFERENQGLRNGLIPLARFLGGFYYSPIIHKSVFIRVPFAEGFAKRGLRILNRFSCFGKKPNAQNLFGNIIYNDICSFYRESNRILIEKHGLTYLNEFGYPL